MSKSSDQTHNLPPLIGNGALPQGIQDIDQRMRQTFANRSLSEGNAAPNMHRNNDDDEFDENNDSDPNKPPPLLTSTSEPIYRTFEGNLTKYNNSVHKTNISSFNAEHNEVKNSFNDNYSVSSSRQGLCRSFFFISGVTAKVDLIFPI